MEGKNLIFNIAPFKLNLTSLRNKLITLELPFLENKVQILNHAHLERSLAEFLPEGKVIYFDGKYRACFP